MPDITMCKGENCPMKENCYRYTAEPNEYHQSYFMEPPWFYKTKGPSKEAFCLFYDPVNEDSNL